MAGVLSYHVILVGTKMPPRITDFVLPLIPYWVMFWLLLSLATIAYIMAIVYYKKARKYRKERETLRQKLQSLEPDANFNRSQASPIDNAATISQSRGDERD